MAPTIRDVAEQAGVSIATVSKVINRRGGVAPETGRRVALAIERLGYVPSIAAQSMRGAGTGMLGVVAARLDDWAAEVLTGVSAAAADRGGGLEILVAIGHGTVGAWAWEHRTLARLQGIDGAILVAPAAGPLGWDLPLVVVAPPGGGVPSSPLTLVSDRPAEAGGEALRLLLDQVALVARAGRSQVRRRGTEPADSSSQPSSAASRARRVGEA
ncbi:LacI family DNA-binding transcriptional regulator [Isoptericola sp. b441]|uniref:LacI family DNA-binding transcriptional regulator n=1 Tax=Actinotalea lenta TaxID=3064654 RepID=A0ABT9D7B5_9CELL|nr:LacI family DNA-binding transcriptional regulator [Isoptericola sp. b441]MDO8106744.1 LacI family DNA-binding transcriptional regulator [Isoptericola sp. b441]